MAAIASGQAMAMAARIGAPARIASPCGPAPALRTPQGRAQGARPRAQGVVRARKGAVEVEVVRGGGRLAQVAELMVQDFYLEGKDLDAGPARGLSRGQQADLKIRYSGRGGLEGAVLGVRDDGGRDLAAAVAIGATPFRGGKALLALQDYAQAGDSDVEIRPVISNLVVRRDQRRRGLGKALVREAEALAVEWGYDEAWLLVEAGNRRARSLYGKAGYRARSSETREAIKVSRDNVVEERQVRNVYMRKSLKGGVIGALENAPWVELLAAASALGVTAFFREPALAQLVAAAAEAGKGAEAEALAKAVLDALFAFPMA